MIELFGVFYVYYQLAKQYHKYPAFWASLGMGLFLIFLFIGGIFLSIIHLIGLINITTSQSFIKISMFLFAIVSSTIFYCFIENKWKKKSYRKESQLTENIEQIGESPSKEIKNTTDEK